MKTTKTIFFGVLSLCAPYVVLCSGNPSLENFSFVHDTWQAQEIVSAERSLKKDFVRSLPSSVHVEAKVVSFALKKRSNTELVAAHNRSKNNRRLVALHNQLSQGKKPEQKRTEISTKSMQKSSVVVIAADRADLCARGSNSSNVGEPNYLEQAKLMLRLAETESRCVALSHQLYNQHKNPKKEKRIRA